MTQPEQNNNEQDSGKIFLTPEEVQAITLDGIPVVDAFRNIFMREGQKEMTRIIHQRGVAGALSIFMNELLPEPFLMGEGNDLIYTFGNRCVLFGFFLTELLKDLEFTGPDAIQKYLNPDPSAEELEKLWHITNEEDLEGE